MERSLATLHIAREPAAGFFQRAVADPQMATLALLLIYGACIAASQLLRFSGVFALVGELLKLVGPIGAVAAWPYINRKRRGAAQRPTNSPERATWSRTALWLAACAYTISVLVGLPAFAHREWPISHIAFALPYLVAYPTLFAGLVLLPVRPLPGPIRARVVLDSAVTMAAAAAFCWYFLVGPALLHGAGAGIGPRISAAYPIFDLVLFYGLMLFVMQADETSPRLLIRSLSLGVLCIVASDVARHLGILHGADAVHLVALAGAPLGFTLVGVSASLVPLNGPTPSHATDAPHVFSTGPGPMAPGWRSIVPYILAPAIGVLLTYVWLAHGQDRLEPGVYAVAAVFIELMLLRQGYVILQNGWLYRALHNAYTRLQVDNSAALEYARRQERVNNALRTTQMRLESANRTLATANTRLEALAATDGMTGLGNFRAFQERLNGELARVQRTHEPLTLLLIDIDYFKHYNDTHGHQSGDDVVATVARLLRDSVRGGDFVARYGGEEFAAILPGTELATGRRIAERLRAAVSVHPFAHREITVSIGIAQAVDSGETAHGLVSEADQALYAAKRGGRNCVVAAVDADLTDDLRREREQACLAAFNEPIDICWGNLEGLLQEPSGLVLSGLLAALDLRDAETEGHSQRVVRFALRLAWEVARQGEVPITPGDLRELALGALLHDIGKIGISDRVLLKPGPLDEEEMIEMRRHPDLGASMLAGFPLLAVALPVVRHHHERWDGTGYPDGLAANDIPLPARIFAVADTLDAMSSDRPYRTARPYRTVRNEIARMAGQQFDPTVVKAFLSIREAEWARLRRDDTAELALHQSVADLAEAA